MNTPMSSNIAKPAHVTSAPLVLLVLLVCCYSMPSGAAEIYRWVDKDGVVNYTQQKPRNLDATPVDDVSGPRSDKVGNSSGKAAPAPSSLTNSTPPVEPVAAAPAAPAEPDAQAKAEYEAALEEARVKGCADARRLVDQLQNRGRIRIRNEAGEEVAMSDAERAKRIGDAQKLIAEHCTS